MFVWGREAVLLVLRSRNGRDDTCLIPPRQVSLNPTETKEMRKYKKMKRRVCRDGKQLPLKSFNKPQKVREEEQSCYTGLGTYTTVE
ncbi:hypothetical protein H5410_026850 [Solanum commersonii]|uniref:Uncharacterized protein n=1 Tax=Solanum commersonii TaxID=4109 RepID=A0A9J5Z2R0_SOLCO|nr:hypothetical protein H5410_026850 [Solanum commersonii]